MITKMPVLRIEDLAKVMIELLAPKYGHNPGNIEIEIIGTKPGEKLYEELISDEETRRAVELDEYFVILPAFRSIYNEIDYSYDGMVNEVVDRPYKSDQESFMSHAEIRDILESIDLLTQFEKTVHPAERYWP